MGKNKNSENIDSLFSQLKEFEELDSDILMQDQYKVSSKAKEKKKKKKKKSKGLDIKFRSDDLDRLDEIMDEEELEFASASDISLFDELSKKFRVGDYGPSTDLIDKESRSYNKNKVSGNRYKKEFAEEHSILYNQLKELLVFDKDISTQYSELKANKVRGQSKFSSDILASLVTIKRLKLDTTAKIIDLKKTIQDLELKAERQDMTLKKNSVDELSSELGAAAFLKDIMSQGRNNVLGQLTRSDFSFGEINRGYEFETDDVEDDVDTFISKSIKGLRSEESEKFLDYEERNVKIMIKRFIETGEWEYIAIDEDGCEIPDYPTPPKGKMTFSADGQLGTDEYTRSYKVIEMLLD